MQPGTPLPSSGNGSKHAHLPQEPLSNLHEKTHLWEGPRALLCKELAESDAFFTVVVTPRSLPIAGRLKPHPGRPFATKAPLSKQVTRNRFSLAHQPLELFKAADSIQRCEHLRVRQLYWLAWGMSESQKAGGGCAEAIEMHDALYSTNLSLLQAHLPIILGVCAVLLMLLGFPLSASLRKRARLRMVRQAEAQILSVQLDQDGTPFFNVAAQAAARLTARFRTPRQK